MKLTFTSNNAQVVHASISTSITIARKKTYRIWFGSIIDDVDAADSSNAPELHTARSHD